MNTLPTKTIFLLITALFIVSCDEDKKIVRSEEVSTGQIYATFQVISDGGDDVYAEAQLTKSVPPNSSNDDEIFVRLTSGDELWLSTGESLDAIDFSQDLFGQFSRLSDTQDKFSEAIFEYEASWFIFDRIIINRLGSWYSATLPQSENGEYRFSLLRNDKVSAGNSMVNMAADFSVISPNSSNEFSRNSDDIIVQWNNTETETQVEIEVYTTCSNNNFDSFLITFTNDLGAATIPAGSLSSATLVGTCSTSLNIRKVKIGQFDSKLLAGAVSSYQVRRAVFNTLD